MNQEDQLAAEGYQTLATESAVFAEDALSLVGEALDAAPLPPLTEEEFYALPANKQRVRLAQEVLVALDAEWLRASGMTYLRAHPFETKWDDEGLACRVVNDPAEALRTSAEPCVACALGGLFLVKVRSFNRCPADELDLLYIRTTIARQLEGIFPPQTLNRIETAFEGFVPDTIRVLEEERDELRVAATFYRLGESSDERLRRIMTNIIANDGEFIVEATDA